MEARIHIGGDISPYILNRLKRPVDAETLAAAVEVIRELTTKDVRDADRALRERAIEVIQALPPVGEPAPVAQ